MNERGRYLNFNGQFCPDMFCTQSKREGIQPFKALLITILEIGGRSSENDEEISQTKFFFRQIFRIVRCGQLQGDVTQISDIFRDFLFDFLILVSCSYWFHKPIWFATLAHSDETYLEINHEELGRLIE